ncbi:MAG: hypothetical protein MUF35_06660 [Candidatus Nanopelagicales bacterium]|nr:hypothetical protein [Candidatus Nanopelagicales bacterium]
MVARHEDPFRLSRRVVTAGLLASGLVWATNTIPVGVDPPGSPGTDPYAGSIAFATVPGWWGFGAHVLLLGWFGLALVLAMAPRARGLVESVVRVVGMALGAVLAFGVILPVATAVRVSLTGFDDPQLMSTLLVTWWAAAGVAMALVAVAVLVVTPGRTGRFTPVVAAALGAVVGCVWPWAMLATAVTGSSDAQAGSPTRGQLLAIGGGMATVGLILAATAAVGWLLDSRGSALIRTWLSRVSLLSGGAASGLCGMLLLMWSWANHMAAPPLGEWLPVLAGAAVTALAAALPWAARRDLDQARRCPRASAGPVPGAVSHQGRAAVLLVGVLAGVLAGCGPTPTSTDASSGPTEASSTPTEASAPAASPSSPGETAALTVGDLASRLEQEWPGYAEVWGSVPADPGRWDCVQARSSGPPAALDPQSAVVPGTVIACSGPPHPELGGEVPVVTVLVLDDLGTVSIAESGNRFPVLHPYGAGLPAGLTCAELLEPGGTFDRWEAGLTPAQRCFATVAYWYVHGQTSSLIDDNEQDIPCQTHFPSTVVDQIRSGGWVTPRFPT